MGLLVAGKDNKLDLLPGLEDCSADAARLTRLVARRRLGGRQPRVPPPPRRDPHIHARARLSAAHRAAHVHYNRRKPSGQPGRLHIRASDLRGCRIQRYQQASSLSRRRRSTFNIHAVTHFINGEAFLSAHLHGFSHSCRPGNGSSCRGCMTNVLIDRSFTRSPPTLPPPTPPQHHRHRQPEQDAPDKSARYRFGKKSDA